jgi:hypothetical protein
MALDFSQQVTQANDEAFVGRVRQAMITQAIVVMGKAADLAEGEKAQDRQQRRTRYAVEALRNPDGMVQGMVRAVVTVDAAKAGMTDQEIRQAVRGLWDAFSEVIL